MSVLGGDNGLWFSDHYAGDEGGGAKISAQAFALLFCCTICSQSRLFDWSSPLGLQQKTIMSVSTLMILDHKKKL